MKQLVVLNVKILDIVEEGIFELMRMSDPIHSLVIKSASAPDIREIGSKGRNEYLTVEWLESNKERFNYNR